MLGAVFEREVRMVPRNRGLAIARAVYAAFRGQGADHRRRGVQCGGRCDLHQSCGPHCDCRRRGARWLSLEGISGVNRDPEAVRDAELRYAQRYRTPRPNPKRVVIEVLIKRVLGSSTLLDRS